MKISEAAHVDSNLGRQTTDADSSTKSDPKDLDSGSKPESLADVIASARKELFTVSSPAEDTDDAITVATAKSKKWKPIKCNEKAVVSLPDSGIPVVDLTGPGSNRRDTNFKERETAAAATTPCPGKATEEDELKEVVVQIRIKILPGAEDIQETVLGLMHHCLSVLKERDKTACFVNSKKSLTAHKLTNFPRDFTDS